MAVKATWNSQELDEKGWISPHCEPAGRCLGNAMLGKIPAGTGRVFGRLIFSLILTTVLNEVAAISCLTTSHISDLTSKYRWNCLRSLRVSHTHTHTHWHPFWSFLLWQFFLPNVAFVLLFVAEESSTISWICLWKARGLVQLWMIPANTGLDLRLCVDVLSHGILWHSIDESWELLIHDGNGHLA